MSCTTFEQAQITKLEALLTAYLDAIMVLLTGAKEYSLDTGQGRQMVKREDVDKLQENYGLVWQQYDALCARCNFGGSVQQTPWGTLL
jgi:hypothetical protein